MKKNVLFILLMMVLSIVMIACSKEEPVEETEPEEEEKITLDEEQAQQVIKDFHDVFMNVIENANDEGEIIDYHSNEELKDEFINYMSEEQADIFVENYFEENDEKLYVIPMETPFWINEEEEFTFEQVSDLEYEVSQEIENELAGHLRLIYVITLRDEDWIVDAFHSEEMIEEDSEEQETDNTDQESESDQSSNKNEEETNEKQESNEDNQPQEEGPEDVVEEEDTNEIDDKRAEELVRNHLNIGENSDIHVVMDHLDENGNFVVQVYELVSDGDVGHTATIGWYIVNNSDGTIEEMM